MTKRVFDVLLASLLLIVFSPVLIAVAVAVRVFIGKPILFIQRRPGLAGKPFALVKFRTMQGDVDEAGELRPDDARLTSFGRSLRSSSLDELPELWNVLKGDMSLVGPRPLLMEYLHLYSPRQARRHEVRPGITGWAQVNGRNTISWEEKFRLDVWYVDNQSLLLDLKILIMTAGKVLTRKGITQDGHATSEKFTGNR